MHKSITYSDDSLSWIGFTGFSFDNVTFLYIFFLPQLTTRRPYFAKE